MKTPQVIKFLVLSLVALGAGYTLGYLDGSGISNAWAIAGRIALGIILLLILAVLAKLIVAVLLRWRGGQPPAGGSGNGPQPPVPRPGGGRPPVLSAAADLNA